MKALTPFLLGAALALPAFAAEPDPNPNRIQTDSTDRPVLNAPTPPIVAGPRAGKPNRKLGRSDGEPAAGDTKPGGPGVVIREPLPGETPIPSPSTGGSAGSTHGKSLDPRD
jgi:hypothetical protein